MKINIESNDPMEMKFTLKEASISFANLLRRYAINSVPVFAISNVVIYENNSSFFDEYIAHRLGLIPLSTPSKGREGEEVVLVLDVSGPGTVYAENLRSTDKSVVPVYPKMPIIKLLDDQNIRMECKAVLASGRIHARHQPAMVFYEIDGDKFNFTIESYGQMNAEEILKKALEKIKEKAEIVESKLKD